ncbi:MAG: hypothetical protein NTW86_12420, partial [Candidatus Sumerlaeota bacterium]|nr:hypothetical protein [Candidatus Sumerlaeota bacterium]
GMARIAREGVPGPPRHTVHAGAAFPGSADGYVGSIDPLPMRFPGSADVPVGSYHKKFIIAAHGDVGATHYEARIQNRLVELDPNPPYDVVPTSYDCENELMAVTSGLDNDSQPIPYLTFYANTVIEYNQFEDINNWRAVGDPHRGLAPSSPDAHHEDSYAYKYDDYLETFLHDGEEGDPGNGFSFFAGGSDNNTGMRIDLGVRVENAKDVDFVEDTFRNLGGSGLGLLEGSENCDVLGNAFYDIDGSGVRIDQNAFLENTYHTNACTMDDHETYPFETDRLYGKNNRVEYNYFTRTGLAYPNCSALLINGAEGTSVQWNEFYNIPGLTLSIGEFLGFRDIKDVVVKHNYFHNVCNFFTDCGAIYLTRSEWYARLWSYRGGSQGLSMCCGQMQLLDLSGGYVGTTPVESRIQNRLTEQETDPWNEVELTTYDCENELMAVTSGLDNDLHPIPYLTFYANTVIEDNQFEDINNWRSPSQPAYPRGPAPIGVYVDYNAGGRPGGLRPSPNNGEAYLTIGPNNFVGVNEPDPNPPIYQNVGYPQRYPDDYAPTEGHYYYDFGKAAFPEHLADVVLNHYPAYGGLSYALWHETDNTDPQHREEDAMESWSILGHETRSVDDEIPANIHAETTEYLKGRLRIEADDCINLGDKSFDYGLMDHDWIKP